MIELRQPIYDADWDWDDEDFKGPITIKGEKFSVLRMYALNMRLTFLLQSSLD